MDVGQVYEEEKIPGDAYFLLMNFLYHVNASLLCSFVSHKVLSQSDERKWLIGHSSSAREIIGSDAALV